MTASVMTGFSDCLHRLSLDPVAAPDYDAWVENFRFDRVWRFALCLLDIDLVSRFIVLPRVLVQPHHACTVMYGVVP